MSMLPVRFVGWLGSVVLPVPASKAFVVALIRAPGYGELVTVPSVITSSAERSVTLPLKASIRPNGTVCGESWTTRVLPLWMSRMSLPSAPVSVVVSLTFPLRASASRTSAGAATPAMPDVSVTYTLLSACAARWQVAVTVRSDGVAFW